MLNDGPTKSTHQQGDNPAGQTAGLACTVAAGRCLPVCSSAYEGERVESRHAGGVLP